MLAVDKVSKSFPGVRALHEASLSLQPGEVHALMGENGAGKSTLIKIITGVYRPDAGEVKVDGRAVTLRSPRDAISLGVAVVHQERNLVPRFSVAENIMLERLPQRGGLLDRRATEDAARRYLEAIGLAIDPRTEVRHLSVAQMQMVEIAKAVRQETRVLLLDEPTASISPHEAETLFALVRRLRENGTAILFVSHKLEEVMSLCDRVTVLRDGEATLQGAPMAEMTRDRLVEAMIGRAEQVIRPRSRQRADDVPKLEMSALATAAGHRDLSLTLHRGEVLGLYGLVGAGRTELARVLVGADKQLSGRIAIDGQPVRIRSVEDALRRHRIGYLSEDRKQEGVILAHAVRTNIAITIWHRLAGLAGMVTAAAERAAAAPLAQQLEIRTPSLEQAVGNLSGGNQQKVSLAKWLAANVDILLVDEPTVGIDIKTKSYIHQLIHELADKGMSLILISSDMPEMIAIADRIAVMHDFRIVGTFDNDHDYDNASRRIMAAIHGGEARAAAPSLSQTEP